MIWFAVDITTWRFTVILVSAVTALVAAVHVITVIILGKLFLLHKHPIPIGRFLPLSPLCTRVVVVDFTSRAHELGPIAARFQWNFYLMIQKKIYQFYQKWGKTIDIWAHIRSWCRVRRHVWRKRFLIFVWCWTEFARIAVCRCLITRTLRRILKDNFRNRQYSINFSNIHIQ